MTLYAAYGSNLDIRRMGHRAPHSPARGSGWLVGWRLTFGGENLSWEGAFATVVEAPDDPEAHVYVMIYDVAPEDEQSLDEWEDGGTGLYIKLRVRVHTLDGEVTAWIYVLDAHEGGLPSARYIGMLSDAAEAAGAPADYVAELRARPCLSTGPGVGDL